LGPEKVFINYEFLLNVGTVNDGFTVSALLRVVRGGGGEAIPATGHGGP
jgi:hypothetical protein